MLGKGTYCVVRKDEDGATKMLRECSFEKSMVKERVVYRALEGAPGVLSAVRFDRKGCAKHRGCRAPTIHMPVADGTLREMPRDHLPQKEILVQLLRGLAAMHARGVIHSDIKPQNIVYRGSELFYIDFGLAVLSDYEECRSGTGRGSPAYEAPEQKLFDIASTASDVFSLAISFHEWVLGEKITDSPLRTLIGLESTSKEDLEAALRDRDRRRLLGSITVGESRHEYPELIDAMLRTDWNRRPSAAECLFQLAGETLLPHVSPTPPVGRASRDAVNSMTWMVCEYARQNPFDAADCEWASARAHASDLFWRAKQGRAGISDEKMACACLSLAVKLHMGVTPEPRDICYAAGSHEWSHLGQWEEQLLDALDFALHVPEQDMYKRVPEERAAREFAQAFAAHSRRRTG